VQVPALFAALPHAPHTALLGTGKLAGFAGTGSAIARYLRHVRLDWPLVLSAASGAFVTSFCGAWIATQVSPVRFRTLVPVLLTGVFLYTLLHRDLGREHAPRNHGHHGRWLAAGSAGAIGLYDGFFGPGTGSFFVFLFVRWLGYDFLNAAGSAKLLNVMTNLGALLLLGLKGHVLWQLGLTMAVANVAGSVIGARVAIRHGATFVRKVFIGVVAALILKTAYDAFLR